MLRVYTNVVGPCFLDVRARPLLRDLGPLLSSRRVVVIVAVLPLGEGEDLLVP